MDDGAAADALGFPQLRKELLAQASGCVLELAVGTGLNLPLYAADTVIALSAVDISSAMLQQVGHPSYHLCPAVICHAVAPAACVTAGRSRKAAHVPASPLSKRPCSSRHHAGLCRLRGGCEACNKASRWTSSKVRQPRSMLAMISGAVPCCAA